MPFKPLSEVIDELYVPGTESRRVYEYHLARARRIGAITDIAYHAMHRIPPRWPTADDEVMGPTNWVGVGPVVAQFWFDVLNGLLYKFENRKTPDRDTFGHIFYSALDGLAWRFFDDEYVPTWSEIKAGRGTKNRLVWRLRRRQAIEVAEHYADQALAELKTGVDP